MGDMDGWNGPRKNNEDGYGRLLNIISDLQRRLAAVERGAPLRSAGIRVTEEGMIVGRSLEVTGDLEVSGSAAITGTLSLPAGIIDNEALASPVTFGRNGGAEVGFAVPQAGGLVQTVSVTVPEGYSRAIVWAVASVTARNTNMANPLDRLYLGAQIGDVAPNQIFAEQEQDRFAHASTSATRLLEELEAGSTVEAHARAATLLADWSADVANRANVDMIAIFLR